MNAEDGSNPYPGLRPFQAEETHLFFGRDEQRIELLHRLRRHAGRKHQRTQRAREYAGLRGAGVPSSMGQHAELAYGHKIRQRRAAVRGPGVRGSL